MFVIKKNKSFIVKPASTSRRIRLGLGFFVKAVRLTQKKLQFTLTTAMMTEVVALCHGLKCHSMRLKRDHLRRTSRFYNRFGAPVEVGSKLAPRPFRRKKKKLQNDTKVLEKLFVASIKKNISKSG